VIITYGFWQIIKLLGEKYHYLIAGLLIFTMFETAMFYKYYFTVYPTSAGAIYDFNGECRKPWNLLSPRKPPTIMFR